jgi:RNA polymerase sigma-70 factor (ECF subfamily)
MGTDSNTGGIGDRQRLIAAARRLLDTQADAEDAVQDAYLRALVACPHSLGSRPAWLHTVLRNIAIDRLRRQQFEGNYVGGRLGVETSLGREANIHMDRALEVRSECVAALRHLLRRVSPVEAAAILLREVFEFEYAEIAQVTGKSEAASRQFLHRALSRARRTDRPARPPRDETAHEEDHHVGLYWWAIESRNPAVLFEMIAAPTTAQARPAAIDGYGASRASSVLVHVNGRYAIALVLDGIVLCIVPVGATAHQVAE